MTAPHPSQSGRPLLVVSTEVTGHNRTGSSLFLVETTTRNRKGEPVTETTGFEGSLHKNLKSMELTPGTSVRIRRADCIFG